MQMLRNLVSLLATAAFAVTLHAQETTASIRGRVTDPSGGTIASAKVIATNLATNVARSTSTASDGNYSLLFVPIGQYKVEISSPGFKKFESSGITLEVNGNVHIDASLQIGAVSDTVEVTA